MVKAGETQGVSLRMAADEMAVPVAGKVAEGVAEALELPFGPGRRLTAVTLEAIRNAVQHAYVDEDPGTIELNIGVDPARVNGDGPEIHIRVRDYGAGCPLEPTSSDPPGLGLSIMSELSEELRISSRRDDGTTIEAVVSADAPAEAEPQDRPAPPDSESEMAFDDPTFLRAVLPRTIAAHAAAMEASIDAVEGAIRAGSAISRSLVDYDDLPNVKVSQTNDDVLCVAIGPVGTDVGHAIRNFLEPEFGFEEGPELKTRESIDPTGFITVTVAIPLH